MNSTIAQRLRATREYVGMELAEAAGAAGVTECELAALEAGSRVPHDLELERLADAYGYRRGYLARPLAPLDEGAVAVVARLGERLSDCDRHEVMLFAAYLRDTGDD
jgi:transcriptional regulator with XRE-family HTH domain